jgi:hypothetical protein
MFHQLVNHNDDIRRLVKKGYAAAFDDDQYLVVRDIPYLDHERKLQWGAIVAKFVDQGQDRIAQTNHEVFFAGSVPHGLDGNPIPNLGGGPSSLALSEASKDVVVQRSFSNKPKLTGAFVDFFEKIESYVAIISGPAMELHQANPLTFRIVESGNGNSPFKVRDTLTSLAEIGDLSAKFKDDIIVVIGLGGTGAYLLDFLIKTPVREIRAFDLDWYYVHNAFRSPGKLELTELGQRKAAVYKARYDNFRTGVSITPKFLDATCAEDLQGATFAFVSVDKGSARASIFDLLISMGIPFIDVEMGLHRKRGPLAGMLCTTYYSPERARELRNMGLAELSDGPDDEYRANIQIGELNALNACLAVIRFKQLRGFYLDEVNDFEQVFKVGDMKIVGDAKIAQD